MKRTLKNINKVNESEFYDHLTYSPLITNISQGIAESKIKGKKSKRIEARLKAVFRNFPLSSLLWQRVDEDFILIDHNIEAELFANSLMKNFLGVKLSDMLKDSPNHKEISLDLKNCITSKKIIKKEIVFRTKKKSENKVLEVNYVYLHPQMVLMYIENITKRKLNEANLQKLSNAVEQTADSVVITNKEGIIEYVNPAFEKTTGYSLKEILGQTPRILNSGQHGKEFYKNLWKTILGGNTYRGMIVNKKKEGGFYWSQQTITPMRNELGVITNFVSVLKDITELREKQEQELRLKIAAELQQRLFKSKISLPGYDFAGKTYSALETCGDYFDFLSMKDGSISLVVGDVCGHGIGAAMIMVQTRAYLRAFAKLESDPGIILTQLNQALYESLNDAHYVTLIFVRLNPSTKILDYSSAGHIPGYIIKNSDEEDIKLDSTGIPLCVMSDYIYHTSDPIKVSSGNVLALLTDGIIESRLTNDDEFGYERTLDTIKHSSKHSAEQIIENLFKVNRSFVKNQQLEDDITSIICKIN